LDKLDVLRRRLPYAGILTLILAAGSVQADENYPARPIRLIIPFAAGGGTDIIGRKFAARASVALGQNFIPDNRAGADGIVGTSEAARAKADGYTLLFGTTSTHVLSPAAMANPPYDATRDFAQIALLATVPMFIATNPSLPVRTLNDLIALARAHPDKLSYGSGASINHLAAELLKSKVPGLKIQHVPYKGSGQSVQDLVGGHIPMVVATYSSLSGNYKAGRVRVVAVLANSRSIAAPEIPTAIEAGVRAVAVSSNIVSAPARTSRAIIDVVHRATLMIARDLAFQKELADLGHEPVTDSSPEKAERFIRDEIVKWTPILKAKAAR